MRPGRMPALFSMHGTPTANATQTTGWPDVRNWSTTLQPDPWLTPLAQTKLPSQLPPLGHHKGDNHLEQPRQLSQCYVAHVVFYLLLNLKPNYQRYCSPSHKIMAVCAALRCLHHACVYAMCMGPCVHARFSSYISPALEYT